MKTSKTWIDHFRVNALEQRVDWRLQPSITKQEVKEILPSLQAWQLGETSNGAHLIRAASLYSKKVNDPDYVEAVRLFIKEEQKHGNNLGRYIDTIGEKRVKQNWGDSLFRKIRYFNTSMEMWTLAVITVESAAQVFYQAMKDATACTLLRQVCSDILIDEAYHIDFQTERMQIIFNTRSGLGKFARHYFYFIFYFSTSLLVWFAHRRLFKAGGINFKKYRLKMEYKYIKTLHRISYSQQPVYARLHSHLGNTKA
ncbi:MAG: ferritin-like domain-containing protein [Ferruginibacter sp.]